MLQTPQIWVGLTEIKKGMKSNAMNQTTNAIKKPGQMMIKTKILPNSVCVCMFFSFLFLSIDVASNFIIALFDAYECLVENRRNKTH